MEVVHQRCAGLDVHQKTVVASVRVAERGQSRHEVRTFSTTVEELLRLSDWLAEQECTHVALESTGVYWKPVWHVLEGSFKLILANAQDVRNMPGRKSDIQDAVWLSDLLAHGLIRGSFVPTAAIQDLRDLTRTRAQLIHEMARHKQRLQKTLEDANIKLTGVISDILGASGRAMVEALIAGEHNAETLAQLGTGRLKASQEELKAALRGRLREHHRFLLKVHLKQIDAVQAAVREIESRVEVLLEPFRSQAELLTTIPGVSESTARVIVAEIGVEMSQFPTVRHLLSWAGLCPRNDQSAGKRRSTRTRRGNRWLKTALVQASWAATRKKNSYLQAQYLRLKARRGPKKAIMAVAASILTAAYFMLKRAEPYLEIGPEALEERIRQRTVKRLLKRLHGLGVQVEIAQAA
jgi:transposase